jgi:hypothetical protein
VAEWERKAKGMSELAASEIQQVLSTSHANDLQNIKLLHQKALENLKSQHIININAAKDQHALEVENLKAGYLADSEIKI